MLQALDYHLLAPSSACFLQCYLMAGKAHTELSSGDSDLITHLAQVGWVLWHVLIPSPP